MPAGQAGKKPGRMVAVRKNIDQSFFFSNALIWIDHVHKQNRDCKPY
jgi:hypothetical protein